MEYYRSHLDKNKGINFAKYFYIHQPPRALTDIAKDIFAIEQETDGLLKEIIEA